MAEMKQVLVPDIGNYKDVPVIEIMVRPGDTISSETKLFDVYWKQGREYRMFFVVGETAMWNQQEQPVGRNKSSSVFLFRNID